MQHTLHQNCDPESQIWSFRTISGCREDLETRTRQYSWHAPGYCKYECFLHWTYNFDTDRCFRLFFSPSLFLHSAFSIYVYIQCDWTAYRTYLYHPWNHSWNLICRWRTAECESLRWLLSFLYLVWISNRRIKLGNLSIIVDEACDNDLPEGCNERKHCWK